jgi:D-3-phosphoglycerate dehydrogenase
MTLRVLVSAPYMIPIIDRYRNLFKTSDVEIVVADVVERLSEDQLMTYAGEIDGVICGDDRFTSKVLKAYAPRLKVISKWGTGIDSIDQEAAAKFGIKICNTPGAFTEPVADSVMSYILAFARRLPWTDQAMKAGRWEKLPGKALGECTLGVVGVGRIGKAVLRRGRAFGMLLLGTDIVEIDKAFIWDVGVEMVPLTQLLSWADYVSLNCDLNPTSYHLIDRQAFAQMRSETVLVNTARGSVIDETAMIDALQKNQIAGVALDVFEDEPLPLDSPLLSMENVLLAPHNANSSPRAWEHVHRNTLRNLFSGLGLKIPQVDR